MSEVDDLARTLMHQIRNSDFLSQNPAQGQSIFQLKTSDGVPDESVEGDQPEVSSRPSADGSSIDGESLEGIVQQLMRQLKNTSPAPPLSQITSDIPQAAPELADDQSFDQLAKMLMGRIDQLDSDDVCIGVSVSSAGSRERVDSAPLRESAEDSTAHLHPDHFETSSSEKSEAASKSAGSRPGIHEALDFLLGELDRGAPSNSRAATARNIQVNNDDEDELVAAFSAMAPTLDAFLLDVAGTLDDTSGCMQRAAGSPRFTLVEDE